jgi:hypothetical protein
MCSIEEIKIDTYACIEEKLHYHACTDYKFIKENILTSTISNEPMSKYIS